MTLRQQIRWNRLLTGELLVFFALLIGGVGAALYAAYGGPAAIAVAVGGVSWALFSCLLFSCPPFSCPLFSWPAFSCPFFS